MADKYTTNFFIRQEEARRNAKKLVFLFAIAVAAIIIVIYLALRMLWLIHLSPDHSSPYSVWTFNGYSWWDPLTFFVIATIVSSIILIASIIKTSQLRGGGKAVAEMLGGTLISGNTKELKERQLLNVVEEMAIASGVPVPLVFVLNNENGINAFAAGLTLNDSAVAVTRGALNNLSREELQGIIGHEFSHILNGDTRLNVQLIGIIFGIMVIGIIGGKILQGVRGSRKGGGPIILIGLVFWIVGYIGFFMGRLIQSAVSRQKEYLADASAVQFTRNPTGIVGALKKIGGYMKGSKIDSASASQASHMFFGESHRSVLFSKFLATHPPLMDRIKRLDPHFKEELTAVKSNQDIYQAPVYEAPISSLQESAPVTQVVTPVAANPQDVIHRVGNPSQTSLIHAKATLESISDMMKQTVNTPAGAASVIYALLLGSDCRERENQLSALYRSVVTNGDIERIQRLCDVTTVLKEDQKLPLVELAVPQLRLLTEKERHNFLDMINALIIADKKTSLFEFFIYWMINQYLIRDKEDLFAKTTFFHIHQVQYDILIILKALANSGNIGNENAAQAAFQAGVTQIPELAAKNHEFVYSESMNFDLIGSSLQQLSYASFQIKQSVVDACAYCAFADKTITIAEFEMLRVLSLTLHCPLPPFVTDKPLNRIPS